MKKYVVEFESVHITEETKNKLETDQYFVGRWIIAHAKIDRIIEETESFEKEMLANIKARLYE